MHISIKNLGIVKSADIDLDRPLTILCGPNGTGKTYVSYILNALSAAAPFQGDCLDYLKNNLDFIFGISQETAKTKFSDFDCSVEIDESCRLGKTSMLTVERNSIYTFKTELSISRNNLVDRLLSLNNKEDMQNIVNNQSRRYPQAVTASLKIANDLENVQKQQGSFYEIASIVEQKLLNGNVEISSNGDVEFAVNKNNKLPFQMSSSMVKTLASFVIYLKHIADTNSLLIIDEPEMNLHPDSQRILAQIFALLVNSGLRLVISTHSDYIIREINNLIMANGVKAENKDEYLAKIGYNKDIVLDKDMVGAYFFKPKSAKSVVVESLNVDDTGFAVPTIDDTINKQNEMAEQLYYDLKYGGDSDEGND